MTPKGRAAFYLCWFYALLSTLVAISEIDLIPEHQRTFYLVTKLSLVWMCVPAGFVLLKDPSRSWANGVVGFSMMIYPGFCGYWRINYEFAVFELLIAYALAFRVSRTMFVTVCGGCIAIFSVVRIWRFDYLKPQFTAPNPADGAFVAIALGVVVLIFYVFINYERRWRESALTRFSLIGQQASNIIHDVKNLVATPSVHASTLKRKLADVNDAEVQTILDELQESLLRTNRLIFDLNEMARLTEGGKTSVVSMRPLVHEVVDLLQNQLRGIAIEIRGDLELSADRALIYSVMMSLFMNAADQFRKAGTQRPVLIVEFENGICRVTDNGGGFDPTALRDLVSDGRAATTKSGGSGMGLYLVSNALFEMGGSASFKNVPQGAIVELKFKT